MHFQTSVHNWTQALVKMPDYTLLKAVNDPALLIDGCNHWIAAGRDPSRLYLDHRYHDFYYPDFDGADKDKTLEEYKVIWRMNFAKTIDSTYYDHFAPYIKLIEELNEYTDTRMVTDKKLLAPRIRSARAAVAVWNDEYRGRNGIPDDARLVVCNSPVGNDIPIEFFQLCRDDDAVLGARTYTKWVDKQRDDGDFRWHSGRPFANEAAYGIKPDYVLGESGPYNGSTSGGWRHSSCLGGDRALLVEAMRLWVRDLATTQAYQDGRILGPGAWFTCNRSDDGKWQHYLLWESELMPLAEMCAVEWKPGSYTPPPQPEPECRGTPRQQYNRVYNVLPVQVTEDEAVAVFKSAMERSRQTVGFSYDDAGVGDLDRRIAKLFGILPELQVEFYDWYKTHYPGVIVEFHPLPTLAPLSWPIAGERQEVFQDWAVFNASRDYDGDGVFDDLHEGLDFTAYTGQPIMAALPGTVVWASDKRRSDGQPSLYGLHIIIEHDGYVTWYAHLSDMISAVGDMVLAGDVIGAAGSTGKSTGPHLHFNVQIPGSGATGYCIPDVVDPLPLLRP